MVSHQVLLVKRIQLDALVILQTFEKHLAEAVKVREIAHLRIGKLAHQHSRITLVVDLCGYVSRQSRRGISTSRIELPASTV
jgi:hypothetical protein